MKFLIEFKAIMSSYNQALSTLQFEKEDNNSQLESSSQGNILNKSDGSKSTSKSPLKYFIKVFDGMQNHTIYDHRKVRKAQLKNQYQVLLKCRDIISEHMMSAINLYDSLTRKKSHHSKRIVNLHTLKNNIETGQRIVK